MPRSARPAAKRARAATTRAFLFSDLRDYTTFVETRGDREAAKLLRDYRALVRREVSRFDGAEVKTEGDSFYVVFESPSAALDCAVAIARKVAAHNEREPDRPLKVGIGIHAGETVAFDKQFVGSAVNVASRLASQAQAGEIIVSDTFRGLVRTGRSYPMSELGPLALKGVSERIAAWSVAAIEGSAAAVTLPPAPAPYARPAAGQVLCPVLIGRDAELAQIEAALDAAMGGSGQTAIVAGEAGGGKSAFVRAVESRAHDRGFRMLRGATLESDRMLPYAPFIAAVRSGFRGIEHDRLGRVLAQTAPDLAQLFPELGRAAKPDGAMEQHRLAVAFHGLFTAFAREAPILIVLEDLHWSDEASLDLLHYLARELRDSRCLLLANYRSDEMHRRHPFLRTLGSLQRERLATEITLRRLTAEEVGRLIQETFETDPVSPEFRDAVYARCEGNPFFAEELLKAMVDSGDIYRTASGWERKPIAELRIPSSIREAVHAHVERLSPDAQSTLSAASVIGLRFPFELLRVTTGHPASEVLAHLRQFIELQLVVEEGGDDDTYAFRHALTREVVYDELLAPERKALHRAVATALEAMPRVEPSLLAQHLIAAGESAPAVPHLLEAARRAVAAGAPREAVAHYERALEVGLPDERIGATLEAVAEAYLRFDAQRSRRAAERAFERYRSTDDARGMGRALMLQAQVASMLGDEQAESLYERAREVVEPLGDTPELATILRRLAARWAGLGRATLLAEGAERLLGIGDRLGRAEYRAWALRMKAAAFLDRADDALELSRQALELTRAAGTDVDIVESTFWHVIHMQHARRPAADIVSAIREGLAFARAHGSEITELVVAEPYYHLNFGNWDEALRSAAAIPRESAYYDNAVEIRERVTEGREGIAAAVPYYLEHEEAWRRLAGGGTASSKLTRLYAAMAQGDRESARVALANVRAVRPAMLVRIMDPRLLAITAVLGDGELLELVLPIAGQGEWKEWRALRLATEAARAFAEGDVARCADRLTAAYDLEPPPFPFGLDTGYVDLVVALTRELRARGEPIGPEWDRPIAAARAWSEKAKAAWWIAELDAARSPR